jgi:hypothetical protein
MRKQIPLALTLFSSVALAGNNQQQPTPAQPSKKVDLVIALDTSSSMDGLIDSARGKLWDVVNRLAQAKPTPTVRVGLLSYGNDRYDARAGWVRKDIDLSTNLDEVYAKLFALTTRGGSEYVARAVHDATTEMTWDQDPATLKILFVAGNEAANQDPKIPVESALAEARERGIIVNTIYCGNDANTEARGWQKVASLGAGRYAAIDHNHVVAVSTPYDAELGRLSKELNKTYVAYGTTAARHAATQRQAGVDEEAASGKAGGTVAASRAEAKSSPLYRNEDWDLVDARAHKKLKVSDVSTESLPAPMQSMGEKEREQYLDGKAKDRAELQKQITALGRKRKAYLETEGRKAPARGPAHFDTAVDNVLGGLGL